MKQAHGAFPAGTVFRSAPSSTGGARYLVNDVVCECPDYQRGGNVCKHVRAMRLVARPVAPAVAPKRKKSYADLFGPDQD